MGTRIGLTTAMVLGGLWLGAGYPAPAVAAAAKAAGCGEACLKGVMDKYLDALSKHDPSLLPVSANYRYTENGARLKLGEGLWATFNSWGKYRHDVYDPETGGVASYLNLTENHEIPFPDLLAVRLKVKNGKVTEIETVISRHANGAKNMPPQEPSWMELMNREEPKATRLTRAELIKGALGYMKSVAFQDPSLAPYAESCIRLENGSVTGLGPNDKPPVPIGQGPALTTADGSPPPERPNLMGLGCGKQLLYGSYSFITGYEDAHFPIVDVKRQIVFATFNFMRRGNVESWKYNGKTIPMAQNMRQPNEMLNTEYFKFVDGKLSRVEALFSGPQAYKMGTGWPGGMKEESRPGK